MSSVREKIIGYLAAGVSQSVAAEAAGVTDGYVSQLLEQEGVREEIALKRSAKLEQHIKTDDSIERGEELALKMLVKKLESPLGVSFKEGLQAFSVFNAAKKKTEAGAGGNGTGSVDHVVFVLPKAAKIMIQVNSDNQIIEVDGKTTAPLPSKVLPQMQKRLELQRTQELPHVVDIKEKAKVLDQERATSMLRDITTVIDGVPVVI